MCIEGQNSGVYNVIACKTVVVTGSNTEGRFIGGLYTDTPGSSLNVTYTRGTAFSGDIDTAAAAWNPAADVELVYTTTSTGARLNIFTTTFPAEMASTWGLAGFSPWCTSLTSPCLSPWPWGDNRHYTNNKVWINTGHASLDGATDAPLRRKVIAHEIGHALGLLHPPTPGTATVMAQGAIGGTTSGAPAAWDIASVNHAYK